MEGLENANLHFHDTRRERLAEKVDVMVLAKISGHRDLSILQNTYYAPDMAEIAQRL
ncbi:integrase [Haemophilus influenzae PittGG]|nr:integrase [Haemophilus influenzae PittGG]